jgi:hypothetical protein
MDFINTNSNFSDLEGDIGSTSNKKSSAILNIGGGTSNNNDTRLNFAANTNNNDQLHISTLDEPVSVTIMRDLKAVGYKFGHVFFPKKSNLLLKDWDLWGPLTLSVILSISLQGTF